MSSTTPGGPRRRRIAGERRGQRAEEQVALTPTAPPVPPTPPTPPTASSPEPARLGTDEPPAEAPAEWVVAPPADEPADEPADQPTDRAVDRAVGGAPAGRGWWGGRASVTVLALALVVLLVFTGLRAGGVVGGDGYPGVRDATAVADAEQEAPATAERAAAAILAYDYQSLDADRKAAAAFMTPAFATKYGDTFEKAVKPSAEKFKAKVTADVKASSVLAASADKVRVLLFVDQSTTSTANDGPQLALNRVEMVMVQRGGSWLVDDISSY